MAAEESLEFRIRMAILGDKAGATRSAEEIGEALRRVYDEFAAEMLRKEPAGDQQALQGVLARIQQLINEAYKVAAGPGFIGAAVEQQRAQKAAGETDKSQAASKEAARANRETAAGEQSRAVGGMAQAVSIAHQEVDDNLLTAQREYNALLQRKIGLGTAYASAVAEGRVLQDKLNNNILAQQIALGGADEIARGKQLQAQMNRLVLEQLASTDAYADELAQAKTLQAQINNQVLTKQLTNGYAQTQAQGTALQAQLNTQTLRLLSAFPGYAQDLAEAKLLQQQVNNQVLREQLGTDYAREMAEGKVLQSQVNNEVLRQQLGTDYAREQAEGKRLQAQVNNEVLREQLTNGYVDEQVEAKALQQRVNNEVLRQQLGTNYAEEQAEGKLLQQQLNTKMRQELAKTGYGTEQGRSDVADRRIKTQRNQFLSSDPDALDAFAEGSRADARLKAERAKLLAADGAYIQAQGEATAAKKLESALSKQASMRQPNYLAALDVEIANTVALAAAKKQAELDYRSSVGGARTIAGGEEAKAKLANRDMVAAQYRRVVQIRELLGIQKSQNQVQRDQVEQAIRGVGLEKTINALQQEEITMRRAAIAAGRGGILPPGGPKDPKGPKDPGGGAPVGGFARSMLTTARYGASSFLLYGMATGIADAAREAIELDRILNQVGRQFESQFGAGGAAQFAIFTNEIFEIAQLTGEGADNVAKLGMQFQGAFGSNTQAALRETRDAIMAVRVTGLELEETIDAFTAITQSFLDVENAAGGTGVTIREFSDVALQLQENLGVLAKETISFSADLAPVAAQMGFTADQLAVLGAVTQKYSGRSGAALAEAYGRVLPQIQESGVQIAQIFSVLGQDVVTNLNEAFASGDIQAAFTTIVGNFNRLAATQQNAVIDLLGGRREAASIIPVLRNGQEAVQEFGKTIDAEGKTVEYFSDLQETLQQKLARLNEEFKLLAEGVFESGLGDFLSEMVDVLSTIVDLTGQLVGAFTALGAVIPDFAMGGLGELLQIAMLVGGGRLVGKGVGSLRNIKLNKAASGANGIGTQAVAADAAMSWTGRGKAATAAAKAAGQGSARSLATGFLKAPGVLGWAGIGAAAGLAIYSGLESSVKDEIAKSRAEFEQGGVTSAEATTELRNVGVETGSGRTYIRERLEAGASVTELKKELGSLAEETASGYEQFIDDLPGELSKKVGSQKAKIAAVVDSVAEAFNESLAEALDQYSQGTAEGRMQTEFDIDQLASEALFNMNMLTGLSEQAASDVQRIIDESGGRLTPQSSLGDFKLYSMAQGWGTSTDPFAEFNEQSRELLNRAIERFGNDATLMSSFLDSDAEAEVREITDRVKSAIASGNLAEEVAALQAESSNFGEEANAVIVQIIRLMEGTVDVDPLTEAMQQATDQYEQAHAKYEAGILTQAAYESAVDAYVDILRAQAPGNPENEEEIAKQAVARRNRAFESLANQIDVLEGLADLGGTNQFDLTKPLYDKGLSDLTGLSIDQRGDLAEQLIESRIERQEFLASLAETEEERDRILAAKIPVGELEQAALTARVMASSLGLQNALSVFTEGAQMDNEELISEISRVAIEQSKSLIEAAVDVIQFQHWMERERVRLERQVSAGVNAMFSALNGLPGGSGKPGIFGSLLGKIRDLQANLPLPRIPTEEEIRASLGAPLDDVPGVPDGVVPKTVTAAKNAKDTKKDEDDLLKRIAEARLDLLMAMVEGDPLAEARVAQQQADLAYRHAEDEAGRIQARADRIRADRQVQDALQEIAMAKVSLLEAQIAGDPLAEAKIAQQRAALAIQHADGEAERINAIADRIRADRQVTEALQAIALAEVRLFEAKFANDPYQVALAAQKRAGMEVDYARGYAERLEAMAAKVAADRAVQEAIWDISDAQVQLLIAMADAAGNTVESARLAVQAVEDEINQAKARGAGEAEMLSLEAQRVAAKASERDAVLSDRQEYYAYLHDMEKITTGQLINYLQSLMTIPDLTDKQIRDIELQIKGLRDELGQDFQFNLPTNLALPTAYEVRRFNQSGSDGVPGGYNDNRSISVTVNAQTNADPNQIASAVATAVGEPSRNGTSIRRYP